MVDEYSLAIHQTHTRMIRGLHLEIGSEGRLNVVDTCAMRPWRRRDEPGTKRRNRELEKLGFVHGLACPGKDAPWDPWILGAWRRVVDGLIWGRDRIVGLGSGMCGVRGRWSGRPTSGWISVPDDVCKMGKAVAESTLDVTALYSYLHELLIVIIRGCYGC